MYISKLICLCILKIVVFSSAVIKSKNEQKIVVYNSPVGKYINGYIDIIDIDHIGTLSNKISSVEDDTKVEHFIKTPLIKLAVEPPGVSRSYNNWGYVHTGFNRLPFINSTDTVTVGIVDTTVMNKHPDLVKLHNVTTDDDKYGDHGTHCMGVILAENNGYGIKSLLGAADYNKNIIPKLYSAFEPVSGNGNLSKIIMAVDRAMKDNVTIMSHSWGTFSNSNALKIVFRESVNILHVVAAGNDGIDAGLTYPASYSMIMKNVITVGAIGINNRKPEFSNYGNAVDVYAPGVDIVSTCASKEYCTMSGTSMATPHVTSYAVYLKLKYNQLTPVQIKNKIISSTFRYKGLLVLDVAPEYNTKEYLYTVYDYSLLYSLMLSFICVYIFH